MLNTKKNISQKNISMLSYRTNSTINLHAKSTKNVENARLDRSKTPNKGINSSVIGIKTNQNLIVQKNLKGHNRAKSDIFSTTEYFSSDNLFNRKVELTEEKDSHKPFYESY
jgi:hypothetical protein